VVSVTDPYCRILGFIDREYRHDAASKNVNTEGEVIVGISHQAATGEDKAD
jgi:hypothetical protein